MQALATRPYLHTSRAYTSDAGSCVLRSKSRQTPASVSPFPALHRSARSTIAAGLRNVGIDYRNSYLTPRTLYCRTPDEFAACERSDHSRDYSRSEEHTSELQSRFDLVCRLLLEKKKNKYKNHFK